MNREKKPLYRKENKRALHHRSNDPGSQYRYERNSKAMNKFEGTHKSIKRTRGGYDYTPLYMFLLSKVGSKWDEVFSEAVSRLDKEDPIWDMVMLDLTEKYKYKKIGHGIARIENAQYHSLTVVDGILVKIDPEAKPYPASCSCHTHTFNGKEILKYNPTKYGEI